MNELETKNYLTKLKVPVILIMIACSCSISYTLCYRLRARLMYFVRIVSIFNCFQMSESYSQLSSSWACSAPSTLSAYHILLLPLIRRVDLLLAPITVGNDRTQPAEGSYIALIIYFENTANLAFPCSCVLIYNTCLGVC